MKTTFRIILETESRHRAEPTLSLDHVASIQVDAPSVEVAARLALSATFDTRSETPRPPERRLPRRDHDLRAPTPGIARHDLEPEAEICRMDGLPSAVAHRRDAVH